MPEELLISPQEQQVPSEELEEVYNDLLNSERRLIELMPEHSRNDSGKIEEEKDYLKSDEERVLSFNFNQIHDILKEAGAAEPNQQCSERYGEITDLRLGRDLLLAAKGFSLTHRTGVLNAYSIYTEQQPWRPVREPIPLKMEDVSDLQEASLEEKTEIVAELLDTYRFRTDSNAPDIHKKALIDEQPVILELIKSMPESKEKDFLAIEAARHFSHDKINQPALAQEAIGLISDVRFQEAVSESILATLDHSPEKIISEINTGSQDALGHLQDDKQISNEQIDQLKAKAEELSPQFAVTVTVSKDTMQRILFDSNRMLSLVETHGSSGSGSNAGPTERMQVEERLGIHSRDDIVSERPIYGALALSREEQVMGAADTQNYGEFVITLKDEVAHKRTSFIYGDSMNKYYGPSIDIQEVQSRRMGFKEAKVAKLIHDQLNPTGRPSVEERYVEAQILGGVTADDIESITVPYDHASYDFKTKQIRAMFPDIKINVTLRQEQLDAISEETQKAIKELGVDLVVLSKLAVEQHAPQRLQI